MSTWDRVAELPLSIDSYSLEGLSYAAGPEFERLTTVIRIEGPGGGSGRLTGFGEDVTYTGLDQIAHQDAGAAHDLTGPQTVGEFCELIGKLDLFPAPPELDVSRLYRRWAYESAALDLALKQGGTNLAAYLDRELKPLTFVA